MPYENTFYNFPFVVRNELGSIAQSSYQPTEENLKARQEFQDNKFGIFSSLGAIRYARYR